MERDTRKDRSRSVRIKNIGGKDETTGEIYKKCERGAF